MAKRVIRTSNAAPPGGPYSQAVVAGDFVHLAGATPHRTDRSLVEGTFAEQARATFDNLAAVAEAAGASLADAVRVGVYLRDLGDFAEMNELFGEYFGAEPPARTTLQADLPGFAIEIDAVLYRPTG
ncbi:reactive intermediate/imine deaminase [Spinactinospora alkalitolerans]|uniref:Reactive intermediate/imine deaminase n=1 Tax=Spinactinospora alkalitolerans TaxID=687207 RepID=A0A852TWX4_9ACTN|nr:Rid family hydrolase [Spinactinospora alkalitolerans]NYE47807.1 reactive intermediate/imine deaminase [Spinactinospora alkalitolerans]